jgi:hypothetical protein
MSLHVAHVAPTRGGRYRSLFEDLPPLQVDEEVLHGLGRPGGPCDLGAGVAEDTDSHVASTGPDRSARRTCTAATTLPGSCSRPTASTSPATRRASPSSGIRATTCSSSARRGARPVAPEHTADWALQIDLAGHPPAQRAKRIDARLSASLIALPTRVSGPEPGTDYASLANRDLQRGHAVGLASR